MARQFLSFAKTFFIGGGFSAEPGVAEHLRRAPGPQARPQLAGSSSAPPPKDPASGNGKLIFRDLSFRALTHGDLDDSLALQDTVIRNLKPHEKKFLLACTREELCRYIGSAGLVFGVFHARRLIAQATIALPHAAGDEAELEILGADIDPRNAGILRSAMVHPEYRSQHLHRVLQQARIAFLRANGREHAISDITVDNIPSIKGMLESGFKIVKMAIDPRDNALTYFLHMPFTRARYIEGFEGIAVDPGDHDFQKALLDREFCGVETRSYGAGEGKTQIIFRRIDNKSDILRFRT